jgi:toxin ParE1/3/4
VKIRLARSANLDLREISMFIVRDDPKAAARVVERLEKAVEFIGGRPSIGRPTIIDDVREWSVPVLPYVIPYRVTADAIEIFRFWHTSRERPDKWQ